MADQIVTLDVREDIREGREPLTRIMKTAADLQASQALRIIAPFELAPLYHLMAGQGFSYESKPLEAGDWEVLFTRGAAEPAGAPAARRAEQLAPCGCHRVETIEVDARGLEPPQPLVTILEALARLPEGAQLRAQTDRRPMHLYAQLGERGFVGETEAQADGSYVTCIRHR
jgi:uncharacterized protein (DUF2249 family)